MIYACFQQKSRWYDIRLTGSVSRLSNFNYSPITKHFNSHVNQGTYRHDDNTRDDDFSHRIKPLVTCKRTELVEWTQYWPAFHMQLYMAIPITVALFLAISSFTINLPHNLKRTNYLNVSCLVFFIISHNYYEFFAPYKPQSAQRNHSLSFQCIFRFQNLKGSEIGRLLKQSLIII
jgi:hypothetical protein